MYKADENFIELLLQLGFIETTDKRDSKRGKKRFKLSKNSKKIINFDHDNIRIINSSIIHDEKMFLTINDLIEVLLFFDFSKSDYNVIDSKGNFKFGQVEKRIEELQDYLTTLEEFKINNKRAKKYTKIINTYNNIEQNLKRIIIENKISNRRKIKTNIKMNELNKILQKSKDRRKIIGIRMFGDEGDFWSGYIVDYNKNLFVIQQFTEFGQLNGLLIEEIANIESIDSDDEYNQAIQYLYETQAQKSSEKLNFELPEVENWQNEIISNISSDKVISIKFKSEFVIYCKILNVDKEFMKISGIGNLGEFDGVSIYRTNQISAIWIGDEESKKRNMLYKKKNTSG